MSIRAVPQFAAPKAVSDDAIRYGYVAYHSIALGNDHQVQPDTSPYHKLIPCRELIPFVNMNVTEIDIQRYGEGGTFNKANISPVKQRIKTAKECGAEMQSSYEMWGFAVLEPLTGLDTEQAFRIFQTIQPFPYKLRDIEDALADAESRIEAIAPYQVSYHGETVELAPLSEEEKALAYETLPLIQRSANVAVTIGEDKIKQTVESMNSRFSGGDGKKAPDPHDKYLSEELGLELPKLIVQETSAPQPQVQTIVQTESEEALALKREEIELRRREIEIKEIELGIKPRPDAVPAAAPPKTKKKSETEE